MSGAVLPGGGREGQTFEGGSRLSVWASFVKLPHTVFALPFALVGVTLASWSYGVSAAQVGWVILAFSSARFAAMAFNRVVDRKYDARNPRTQMREIPQGRIDVGAAKWSVAIASVVFVLAAGMLNPLCLWLSPIALGWVLGYSYTKRFTRYAHLWLGIGLSIAPSAGWLAVSGAWPMPGWFLPLLSLGVAAWTGGFDVLYALPDAEFDRTNGLWSIPSTIGVPKALLVARLLHVVSVLAFVVVGHTLGLIVPGFTGIATTLWWAGLAAVALLLLYEHTLVSADDLSKLDAAFFTMNGIISLTFFGFVLAARLVAGSW